MKTVEDKEMRHFSDIRTSEVFKHLGNYHMKIHSVDGPLGPYNAINLIAGSLASIEKNLVLEYFPDAFLCPNEQKISSIEALEARITAVERMQNDLVDDGK